DRALRAQGVHARRDLERQLVRPVGRRARQEARVPDRAGAHGRGRTRAPARLLDERADPAVPGRATPSVSPGPGGSRPGRAPMCRAVLAAGSRASSPRAAFGQEVPRPWLVSGFGITWKWT